MTDAPAPQPDEIDAQVDAFLDAWFKVRQYVQGLNFNRAHQHGMSTTQFLVLALLDEAHDAGPATIRSLANRLNLDPATVVRTVDSLEQRGLVARRRDTADRRRVFVEFTEQGRAAEQSSRLRFKDSVARTFRAMSPAGRRALLQGLQEFVAVGGGQAGAPPERGGQEGDAR